VRPADQNRVIVSPALSQKGFEHLRPVSRHEFDFARKIRIYGSPILVDDRERIESDEPAMAEERSQDRLRSRKTGAQPVVGDPVLEKKNARTAGPGPATASLALVSTALEALKSMDESSPFITLFNRESQTARTAHFQISVADQSPAGDLSVALMAFGLEASTQLTQVLFFKSLSTQATLRHCSARVGVNADVLLGVRDALKTKLVAHASDWMKTLPDLD
jgi:hypothetical protein